MRSSGGLPLPAEAVRRIACDCSLTNMLLGEGTVPLAVGCTTRLISPPMWRALVVRDRGCRTPGCDTPMPWTEGHHLIPWEDGGETELSNLVQLCRRHHRMAHEGGWRLIGDPNGEPIFLPPNALGLNGDRSTGNARH